MNHSTKILFTDVDGTLLNDRQQISPGNRLAIKEALKNGHKIVITTGRSLASASHIIEQLGLNLPGCYSITYNGGAIHDSFTGCAIYETSLGLPIVSHIFDEAEKKGLHVQTYAGDLVIAKKNTKALETYKTRTNLQCKIVDDIGPALSKEPCKVLVIDYDDHEKLISFQSELEPWIHGKADSIFSCDAYLEYISPGVSKGHALKILCRHLDIPIKNTIAAGDAQNDISMIQAANLGIFMKNAHKDFKKYADYVTENDNNHDGLAEIIHRFILD